MLITYRERDISGEEFAAYYYMSMRFGTWTRRALVQTMVDGCSTGVLQGANPDALLSIALARGETVYLTGEDLERNVDIHVPYTLSLINAKFTEFNDFCRDTSNNNHCEGSAVNVAPTKILNEREAVDDEYADVFIQWLLYGEVPFG